MEGGRLCPLCLISLLGSPRVFIAPPFDSPIAKFVLVPELVPLLAESSQVSLSWLPSNQLPVLHPFSLSLSCLGYNGPVPNPEVS